MDDGASVPETTPTSPNQTHSHLHLKRSQDPESSMVSCDSLLLVAQGLSLWQLQQVMFYSSKVVTLLFLLLRVLSLIGLTRLSPIWLLVAY